MRAGPRSETRARSVPRRRLSRPLALAALACLAVVALSLASGPAVGVSATPSATLAPNFTLPDIYGQNFTLSSYRGSAVVVIEFTSLSCSECQIVEQSLATIASVYNQSGSGGDVRILSVFIEPQFGDTIPALRTYQTQHDITWTMAQDTPTLAVSKSYGVQDIPTVVTVNKNGQAIYDVSGPQSTTQLETSISSGLAGTAAPISIITVSVFGLAVVAGLTTFFSPCAFPMFPGYMTLYLGLNSGGGDPSGTTSRTYKGAVRRALFAGSVASSGMLVVFLGIGLALIVAASRVGGYIPYFLVLVGAILVGLGLLLLTNLQYWRIVTPVQTLWRRIRGVDAAAATPAPPTAPGQRGFYLKLFGYGMGYAAAAAGCVAPVIFSAIIAGMALGLFNGIVSILIYSLTAALLMVVVTVMLAVAGKRYINALKTYTPVIKKVSAVVLVLVGVYLIYFYYTAWGF